MQGADPHCFNVDPGPAFSKKFGFGFLGLEMMHLEKKCGIVFDLQRYLICNMYEYRKFSGLPDPLVRGTDPDPSIIEHK
jgi:hypothetical protein